MLFTKDVLRFIYIHISDNMEIINPLNSCSLAKQIVPSQAKTTPAKKHFRSVFGYMTKITLQASRLISGKQF
jgi:hypothetical protein